MVGRLQLARRGASAAALRAALLRGEAPVRALALALGGLSPKGSPRLTLGATAVDGALILALSGESLLSLASWGTCYISLAGLGGWTGHVGLDWAFHVVSFCITHGSTVYVTRLNRAGGCTLHVANLRLARSLAQNLAWSLAQSLAHHRHGLGLARSLALHLGGFRLG